MRVFILWKNTLIELNMLAKLNTLSLLGIEALPVEVEVDVSSCLCLKTVLVGLPEQAVKEERPLRGTRDCQQRLHASQRSRGHQPRTCRTPQQLLRLICRSHWEYWLLAASFSRTNSLSMRP